MGKPYSRDLRQRFATLLDQGLSASAAGHQLLVPRSTATRWGLIWRTEKRAEALPMGGDRRSGALEAEAATILALIETKADIFLREIVAALDERGITASEDAVRRLLIRHGVTWKKRLWSPRSGSAKTSLPHAPSGRRA